MRRSNSSKYTHSAFGNAIIMLFLTVFAFVMMVPMIYTICTAFKPNDELFRFPPSIFVQNPTVMNFYSLSSLLRESWVPFSRYLFNSVLISGLGTLGNVIFSSLAAYRIAKFEFPGRKLYFSIVTMSLMFSSAVTSIANFLIMSRLNMIDTYWAIIVPACGSSLGLFLMKQFMEQMVPDALIEAAQIDGAGEWKLFTKVAMPICKGAIYSCAILVFIDYWNMVEQPLILFTDTEKYPLSVFLSKINEGEIGLAFAVATIYMIPGLLIFLYSEEYLVEGITYQGGIKG